LPASCFAPVGKPARQTPYVHLDDAATEGTMTSEEQPARQTTYFELTFMPLHDGIAPLSFPCDAQGQVDMDELSERSLGRYLYARAMTGREYAAPTVTESSGFTH
jgi:hypothetical protein